MFSFKIGVQEVDDSPYTAPKAELNSGEISVLHRGRLIAGLGLVLFTGPIWGMLLTVFGMFRAFDTIGDAGTGSPDAMSQDVMVALTTTAIGIVVGAVGGVLVLVAFLVAKNREPWFFQLSILLSVFWCLMLFPFGLIIGLPISILFVAKRQQFHAAESGKERSDSTKL